MGGGYLHPLPSARIMSLNLARQPISAIRAHVGSYVYWRKRETQRGLNASGGWGKLIRAAGRNLWLDDQHGEVNLYLPELAHLEIARPRTIPPTWQDLRMGSIIGIVDSNDAVDSRFIPSALYLGDHSHSHYWPQRKNGLWRWMFDKGLTAFVPERAWAPEQTELIHRHITKLYGIQWWENGYHNLDHFLAHLNAERYTSATPAAH